MTTTDLAERLINCDHKDLPAYVATAIELDDCGVLKLLLDVICHVRNEKNPIMPTILGFYGRDCNVK